MQDYGAKQRRFYKIAIKKIPFILTEDYENTWLEGLIMEFDSNVSGGREMMYIGVISESMYHAEAEAVMKINETVLNHNKHNSVYFYGTDRLVRRIKKDFILVIFAVSLNNDELS